MVGQFKIFLCLLYSYEKVGARTNEKGVLGDVGQET